MHWKAYQRIRISKEIKSFIPIRSIYTAFLLFIFYTASAQSEKIEYRCSSLYDHKVSLHVEYSKEPLDYQGEQFYILKYNFTIDQYIYNTFFLYKYDGKLYLLDENSTTLNYTKDQVLFDINQSENKISHVSGIFDHIELNLDDWFHVNDLEFYIYNAKEIDFSNFSISKMVFDKNLDIVQMTIKSGLGECYCIKKNIVIKTK